MCGITGIFDTRGQRPIGRAVLQRMNDSQLHHSPDEGSLHIEPGLGLGHRRQSRAAGHHRLVQPALPATPGGRAPKRRQ
ncbi:MAG: hypothetical protein Q8M01_19980 [Rubrivivax sp.]|nr:hypothetical protein [Rubrivivax sp.]